MNTNGLTSFVVRTIALMVCFAFYLGFSSPQIVAGFDWLKAGKDLLGGSTQQQTPSLSALSDSEIGAGLKDALRVGTERVV
ncbi:MAG: hypothetical protein QNK27_14020, partial [Desulfuromusa sp.]|nr:hypothetical protein [Desulfuromusa sp.]